MPNSKWVTSSTATGLHIVMNMNMQIMYEMSGPVSYRNQVCVRNKALHEQVFEVQNQGRERFNSVLMLSHQGTW